MVFDPPTLFVVSAIVGTTGGLLLLLSWLQDRSQAALAISGIALMLVPVGSAIVVMHGLTTSIWTLQVGPVVILAGYGLVWLGARSFEGRPLHFGWAFAGALLWLIASQFDWFAQDLALRMRASSVLIVVYTLLALSEYWHARDTELVSRWPAIIVLALHALCFTLRFTLVDVLPFPGGVVAKQIEWFPVGVMAILLHNFCMAFLIVAMAKERSELQYRKTAQLDPLTGVANRRAFMERAERSLRRAVAERKPVAMLLLDLDLFKQINDTFGHQTGDRVLCTFCDIATAALRPSDVFGRLGGEEFACLLPGASASEALRVAERIRASFEGREAEAATDDVVSTVSVGVATIQDVDGELDALMLAADRALYQAKAKGRNRVERAAAPPKVAAPAVAAA